jgi:hypothetical protein
MLYTYIKFVRERKRFLKAFLKYLKIRATVTFELQKFSANRGFFYGVGKYKALS